MSDTLTGTLKQNVTFQRLFWAHVISLVGSGLSSVALGLLAHQLVGASASVVLGMTLAIRIGVIVFFSPWAGFLADYVGARRLMILSDIARAAVVIGFFLADQVWQVYVLAFFLNLGAAVFTPVYKALIPGIVSKEDYPRALSLGSIAYDTANILGPTLAALTIAVVGFRGNFVLDGLTFLASAALLFGLPRLAEAAKPSEKSKNSVLHGVRSMFSRWQLRETLYIALQVSVAGAFVLVATVSFVKSDLALPDSFYGLVMGAYGVGSVLGAFIYSKLGQRGRDLMVSGATPAMLFALLTAGVAGEIWVLSLAWLFAGAGQALLGIRGNELLAENSVGVERPHIYAAHFSLSHAGWGLFYPLAGWMTASLGFATAAFWFSGLLVAASIPQWAGWIKQYLVHRGLADSRHQHSHSADDPDGHYHAHEHRHGDLVHSHPHHHGIPHSH